MFERSVCDFGNRFVRSRTVGLNDDGLVFALGRIQKGPELFHVNSLVLEINRRNCTAADADNLLAVLRTERKPREGHRNRDALLQDEIRTEQEEEHKQKGDVHQRHKDNPAEIEVHRAAKLHERLQIYCLMNRGL
jgi:hypothetical protein